MPTKAIDLSNRLRPGSGQPSRRNPQVIGTRVRDRNGKPIEEGRIAPDGRPISLKSAAGGLRGGGALSMPSGTPGAAWRAQFTGAAASGSEPQAASATARPAPDFPGAGNAAPFRGSTPDEIAEFNAGGPESRIAADEIRDAAGKGFEVQTPFGPVQSRGMNWQEAVVKAHPEIGQAGTPQNLAFIQAMKGGGAPENAKQIADSLYPRPAASATQTPTGGADAANQAASGSSSVNTPPLTADAATQKLASPPARPALDGSQPLTPSPLAAADAGSLAATDPGNAGWPTTNQEPRTRNAPAPSSLSLGVNPETSKTSLNSPSSLALSADDSEDALKKLRQRFAPPAPDDRTMVTQSGYRAPALQQRY